MPLFLSEVHALASPALSVTLDAIPSAWLLLPTTISAHLSGNQIPWFTALIGPDSVNGSVRTLHGKIIENVTLLSLALSTKIVLLLLFSFLIILLLLQRLNFWQLVLLLIDLQHTCRVE